MLYLAYGSNLHPVRLRDRVPSARLLGNALVHDRLLRFHKRSVIDGSAKCNIYPGVGIVHAAVYEIADNEKHDLDRAESLGQGYRAEWIDVTGFGECYCYVATESHIDDWLKPYSWYRSLVVAGCEYLQFPADYIAQVKAVSCIEDPNRKRHDRHMQLLRRATHSKQNVFQDQ